MAKILLLSMPYGALERQALGLSLLKAQASRMGVECDLRYFTFTFAEFIGYENYQWISNDIPYTAFAGDWTFTGDLYGEDAGAVHDYVQNILINRFQLEEPCIRRIARVRSMVSAFLDYCEAAIPWAQYDLVGFTSTFEQNIASLSLAQRIKRSHSHIKIAFGGANWEAEMGQELHRRFPFVDYVCSGEAEESFPKLLSHLADPQNPDAALHTIPGIVYRTNNESVSTHQGQLVLDMDGLPFPDFSDYFQDLSESTVAASVVPILLMETSRGCWWGAKQHCTFCGLNGGSMGFRSKSAARTLQELRYLTDRWRIDLVELVDNILDMRSFDDLLPALVKAGSPYRLFYEVKANLSRRHVELLSRSGVYRIQPGIESMSDHVLHLMRKGTSALRNIQLLKWCREYGIGVDWNILYGFPGETEQDYGEMLNLFPAIRFLSPPTACGPVRLDRFSPYFNTPEKFGLTNVRPLAAYHFLYPFPPESLEKLAYFFDYDYKDGRGAHRYASKVIAYVQAWQCQPEPGMLSSVRGHDGSLVIWDTRSDAVQREYRFTGVERAAYEYCDDLRDGELVARHLRKVFPEQSLSTEHVIDFLNTLVTCRLMVTDGQHFLSLAIPAQPIRKYDSATDNQGQAAVLLSEAEQGDRSKRTLPMVHG